MRILKEKFWPYVDKKDPDKCWNWTGSLLRSNGRGRVRVRRKTLGASRVSWELHYGPIPEGMQVLHKCDNKLCVNPNHLELGTQSKNMQDCSKRGRLSPPPVLKGEDNYAAKLTWEKVREIRASNLSGEKLAPLYGVCEMTIYNIKHNKSWKE